MKHIQFRFAISHDLGLNEFHGHLSFGIGDEIHYVCGWERQSSIGTRSGNCVGYTRCIELAGHEYEASILTVGL